MVQELARPILLVTRPGAGAERFAARFRERFGADWPIVLSPLMRIRQIEADIPSADAVIFTSQHAVAALAAREQGAGRVAYCVGQRTAQAARAAGFVPVTGPGDAQALGELIVAEKPQGALLFARGEEVAFDLGNWLSSAGIETKKAILYRQEPLPPSNAAMTALTGDAPCLIPLFSPNAARRLCEILPPKTGPLWVAMMSEAVANACKNPSFTAMQVAPRPDLEGMLDALAALLRAQKAG
ncbi:uroporphyrinogen-III synthase [Thioclava pacifica]|uniref:Uroporphyrinogen-III synthase n=1 Tax=Thioclava pacifica DSM 10166 TaxID=1353537 RepID=A0A074JYB1_9RHOB|nr:uroporphyrinogen-III synthase [Thioclava pacifica]KEO54337.1 hypothetical protein TP2_05265 [Thioclava pacifica DSM 10166]